MKKVAIILHENFEESEAIVTIDILRRSEIIVDIYNIQEKDFQVGSHNITVKTEYKIESLNSDNYDGIVIPGGPGINNLFDNEILLNLIRDFNSSNKLISAICAAPQILGQAGVIDGIKIVKFPTSNKYLEKAFVQEKDSIIDKNIVTGSSIGTVVPFALNIIEYLQGKEQKEKIKQQLVII
ncbi:DJ-1 family glyoxalase III [Mesoplasma coleopterae]|uniref:4-methyl-5(B-hydroxyethyl)-thiazole monophosphate biosynthesis n=1 Tax=Mesoplasma coleopterae TaxID=324078 RepID=A0A2K8P292_9MOLU|nr:DJ-1 family glyoxalase III [Mesoplasma coleopterae]ATZ20796.1 4-methyl-5(b-hydroxyethyl)-thiazole monophosphate biosynthesis [Mesoplasma coleopterae]AVN62302.1 protease [Mesoplasma coleopterae]AVN62971.1 protease [Mesoplasma coleopterae]